MMAKNILKLLSLILIVSMVLPVMPAIGYSEDEYIISDTVYYIKSADSGQYLNVDHDVDANGTNILQYPMNGKREEWWTVVYVGNGLYKFVSAYSSGRVLDIEGASAANGANLQLHVSNDTDAQRFALERTPEGTYKILTKCSNYTRVLTVQNASCESAANVFQWQYQDAHCDNDEWIFEPVYNYSPRMGAAYAKANYNNRLPGYPDLSNMGGDCTNFVSQCMLAGGVHYQGTWWIYKLNHTYHTPSNSFIGPTQLNYSWSLSDPSPWISAREFNNFWSSRVVTETYSARYILANKREVFFRDFYVGDVIQILDGDSAPGDAWHSMYITGYSSDINNPSFLVTYHSIDKVDVDLLDICNDNPDAYFRFFTII